MVLSGFWLLWKPERQMAPQPRLAQSVLVAGLQKSKSPAAVLPRNHGTILNDHGEAVAFITWYCECQKAMMIQPVS